MGLFLLVVGFLFLAASIRGPKETAKLIGLLRADFTGPNNFFIWAVSLGIVAAIGYWRSARTFSNLFLALIFVVLIFTKKDTDGKDFLSSFIEQLSNPEKYQ